MEKRKSLFAGFWILFTKIGLKAISIIAKLSKAAKIGKVGFAAATLASYSVLFSWKFAVLIMIAVGWHESGHVWAMKKVGIKTKGFYFIPFLGGAAIAEGDFETYGKQAFVAIMGPIWGLGLAWVSALIYWLTYKPIFAAAAGWMATITIFNLLPVNPLDGGRIMHAITSSINETIGLFYLFISCILCSILLFKLEISLFGVLLIVVLIEGIVTYYKIKDRIAFENAICESISNISNKLEKQGFKSKYTFTNIKNQMLTKSQMAATIFSYIVVCFFSILLIYITKHVPGADIAAQFLN